jgi:hypothetical protein
VLGINRWFLRVVTYATLLTDNYPPFPLDTGGNEPAPDTAISDVVPADTSPCALVTCGSMSPSREPIAPGRSLSPGQYSRRVVREAQCCPGRPANAMRRGGDHRDGRLFDGDLNLARQWRLSVISPGGLERREDSASVAHARAICDESHSESGASGC